MFDAIRRMNFNRLPFGLLHPDTAIQEAARLTSLALSSAARIYGPRVYTRKNVGRDWTKYARSNRYRPHQGEAECARRCRQIAAGRLTASNGRAS